MVIELNFPNLKADPKCGLSMKSSRKREISESSNGEEHENPDFYQENFTIET